MATGPKRSPRKYKLVSDWVTKKILDGEFARGEKLPSEHELMKRFTVSRVTARQAFAELRQCGLVESRQGKGYFVRQLKPVQDLGRLQSFGEMMAPFGVETRSDVIEVLEVPAPSDVSAALKIDENDAVIRIMRTRLAGGTAISLDISYFPLDIGRRISVLDLCKTDIFLLLENELQIGLGYADVLIDVVPIEARHAKFLGIEAGVSVIRLCRLTHDLNGTPIDFERIYSRVDSAKFRTRIARW